MSVWVVRFDDEPGDGIASRCLSAAPIGPALVLKAGPVPRTEVDTRFSWFRFPLPEDYLSYVEKYGGAIVGPYRVFGLRKAAPMGVKESSALEVTDRFVKQRWPGTENWLIISTDHSGNPVGLAVDGNVWISDHDNGQITVIAPSFESFLRLPFRQVVPTKSAGLPCSR